MRNTSLTINGQKLPKKVGLIYSDVKRQYFPTKEQYITEKDAFEDAKVFSKYLKKMGFRVSLYPGNANLAANLKRNKPQIIFNLVDSVKGSEFLSSVIPGILEMLDIPYTGADILGKSLDTNKFLIKKILQQNGIPVPIYQLVYSHTDTIDSVLKYPLISKLNEIHGSVEINKDAVSENERHLRKRIKYLTQTYNQPVLIEEFIVGKEITAILLEGLNKKVYLAERVFSDHGKYNFMTFEDQWQNNSSNPFHYVKFEDNVLKEYVKKVFDITKMYDYAKFDVRIDQSGRYFFIDTNCNPAFGPKELDVAITSILDLYGISFSETLKRLIINTLRDAKGKDMLPYPS